MESRPERAEKSEFRRWEFAGFQGVNPANPANTITLTKAETSLGGGLQRSSPTTIEAVTKRIKGGLIGLDDRKACYARACTALEVSHESA